MITANQTIQLAEEYLGVVKIDGKPVVVYKNPTSSDIQEIIKSFDKDNRHFRVRFIIDLKTKSVYVWDAYLAVHQQIWKSGLLSQYSSESQLTGEALIKSNKLEFLNSDILLSFIDMVTIVGRYDKPKTMKEKQDNWLVKFFNMDWSWSYKYISGLKEFIDKKRKELDNWIKRNDFST